MEAGAPELIAASPAADRLRPALAGAGRLALLYACSVILYALFGRVQSLPFVAPDEYIYGHLAQSLADGQGFSWRGEPVTLRAALYVYLITPAWLLGSPISGYAAAKVIGAALLCLVVIPVFALARELLGIRMALMAAAMSVAGTWMTTGALLLTENAALPLATAALCAAVMGLRRPASRWMWVALALALLATWARIQVAVLIPAILGAVLIEVARAGSHWRERAREHRAALAVTGGATAAFMLATLVDAGGFTGTYYDSVLYFGLGIGVLAGAIRQWIALVPLAGFLPFLLVAALASSGRAWRDETLGPLLAVLVAATAAFVVQSGWFLDGANYDFAIQRYVEYVVPLALVALLVGATRWELLPPFAWAVIAGLSLLELSGSRLLPSEGSASYISSRPGDLVGLPSWVSVAFTALAVGLTGLWLTRRQGRAGGASGAAWVAGAVTLAVLVLQGAGAWIWQLRHADEFRAGFPADLRWVDHTARGPVARLVVTASHPRWLPVELFNKDVEQVFALASSTANVERGPSCRWTVGPTGTAEFADGCGPAPRRFYLDDPAARVTFVDQTIVGRTRGIGRIVSVPGPPSLPRVRSIAVLPCDDRTLLTKSGEVLSYTERVCRAVFSCYFWLDRPAELVLRIKGGERPHEARLGPKAYAIAPSRITTIRVPLAAGASRIDVPFDTQELPLGYPDVVGAQLVSGGRSESIL